LTGQQAPGGKKPRSHTDGLLVIDKPPGWTSHDAVARCRSVVGQKRIGHAGTLDPGATGVLLMGLGRAARLMRFVSALPKLYVGDVVLGVATSTLDDDGEKTGQWDMSGVTLEEFAAVAARFVGDIEQIPPMVSAIKIKGKRLHELARSGIEVERKPRPVTISRLEVAPTNEAHVFRIELECSPGTYVRSLAADIGTGLGGGAHLRKLRRMGIGPFTAERSLPLDALDRDWRSHLLTPAEMVGHLGSIVVDDETAAAIEQGKALDNERVTFEGSGPWSILNEQGDLVAVYEGLLPRPAVVLVRPSAPPVS